MHIYHTETMLCVVTLMWGAMGSAYDS